MALYTYSNPTNGYKELFGSTSSFFATLIFGPFYFIYKGVWLHVVISIILAHLTEGLSWFIYPFFTKAILRKYYLKKGMIEHIEE